MQVDTNWLLSGFYGEPVAELAIKLSLATTEADRVLQVLRLSVWLGGREQALEALKNSAQKIARILADPTKSLDRRVDILVACELASTEAADDKARAVRMAELALRSTEALSWSSQWCKNAYQALAQAALAYCLSQDSRAEEARSLGQQALRNASGEFLAETQFLAGMALLFSYDFHRALEALENSRKRHLEDGMPVRAVQCILGISDCLRYGQIEDDRTIYERLAVARGAIPAGYRGRVFESLCFAQASASRAVGRIQESDEWLDQLGVPSSPEVRATQTWQRGINHKFREEHPVAVRLLIQALEGLQQTQSRGVPCAALHLAEAQRDAGLPWEATAHLSLREAKRAGITELIVAAREMLQSGLSSAQRQRSQD